MGIARPSPDQLLADVQQLDRTKRRGQLKIFLGYAAGVGKTYAMLEGAHRARKLGREVVLGYIEPHARPETASLMTGLESVPPLSLNHRGVSVQELDVDAALARHPDLILVDELAHSNPEGCRHAKRWQDIEELLAAGIHVWTTLNVQHIESLNDVIQQITGIVVREKIPDKVFESANDIELVDIAPDDLVQRLEQGKIYSGEQAQRALVGFFQKPNLNALRELALRLAARRIHNDVEGSRRERGAVVPWNTSERIMVCVGPSPTNAKVIRSAKRMADVLTAPWLAVSVETSRTATQQSANIMVLDHFRLAESLGAETVTLYGDDVTQTLLDFARSRNVTKILIGKTNEPWLQRLLHGSVVDRVLQLSAEMDVIVVQGASEQAPKLAIATETRKFDWKGTLSTLSIVAVCALLAGLLRRMRLADSEANTVMIFLAGVAFVAFRYGRGYSVLACVLAVLTFDFVFVPPYWTFAVSDAQYFVTFLVMLTIGFLISSLTLRLRQQVSVTQKRQQRTAALYALGKQLASLYGRVFLCNAAASKVSEIIGSPVTVYLLNENSVVEPIVGDDSTIASHPISQGTAQWVATNGQVAGAGTSTLPAAPAVFFPLIASQSCLGAMAVAAPHSPQALLAPDSRHLLESCASQLALALERDQLTIDAAEAHIEAETESLRSSLLSSVSHDLRTPLATIAGASSSLLASETMPSLIRKELLQSIHLEADRLGRLLENILQMTRMEAGKVKLNRQWHVLEELVGVALQRTRSQLAGHRVTVDLPIDLPLILVDGLLLEQLLVNLLENVAVHTPAGTEVRIESEVASRSLFVHVLDSGPGVPQGAEEKIFEKFYRAASTPDSIRGSGLGLAVCRAIATSHAGSLHATKSRLGGAKFTLMIPLDQAPPTVTTELEP